MNVITPSGEGCFGIVRPTKKPTNFSQSGEAPKGGRWMLDEFLERNVRMESWR